jgi:hypothetical protein
VLQPLVQFRLRVLRREDARMSTKRRAHDHVYCQRCDHIEARLAKLTAALDALVVVTPQGQVCFRSHNGVPMGMSRKQERLAQAALDAAGGA